MSSMSVTSNPFATQLLLLLLSMNALVLGFLSFSRSVSSVTFFLVCFFSHHVSLCARFYLSFSVMMEALVARVCLFGFLDLYLYLYNIALCI